MNRTDVAIADIARALCDLSPNLQNRKAIFEKSLRGLVEWAIEQRRIENALGAQNDLARVEELLAQSKQ